MPKLITLWWYDESIIICEKINASNIDNSEIKINSLILITLIVSLRLEALNDYIQSLMLRGIMLYIKFDSRALRIITTTV